MCRKPQYALSSPLPLNLYSCEFDEIDWKNDEESTDKVIKTLQSYWTFEAIKKSMLESMLKDYSCHSSKMPADLTSVLFKDNNSRNYKPLFNRPVAQSLEDRVLHYIKRGKLKSDATIDNGTAEE